MKDELKEIVKILQRVFPKLLEDPNIMRGCDISKNEIEDIKCNQGLSLGVLSCVAGDRFFQTFNKEIGISGDEAEEVDKFLYRSAPFLLEELKLYFPYLIE